jgi:AraC-like DNA-binding protein/quercetin dioxygenase-like cupin family protein
MMSISKKRGIARVNTNEKRGFLGESFRLFHIKGREEQQFSYHYHDFHKIVLCLEGQVTYIVEGKTYFLKPWDMLLVKAYDIHRPVISGKGEYERIVIWIRPEYIESLGNEEDLNACFSEKKIISLLTLPEKTKERLTRAFRGIERESERDIIGSSLLKVSYMNELLVYLNRLFAGKDLEEEQSAIKYNSKTEEIMNYINSNLREDLSVESIASHFFLSRSYLMHRFKEETGYTILGYVSQKRLSGARKMMAEGESAAITAEKCGFKDYGAFLRAFKKEFGVTPKEYAAGKNKSVTVYVD